MERVNSYPTREELDFYPFRGIQGTRREEWYNKWAVIEHTKLLFQKEGESMIEEFGRSPLPTKHGDWTYIVYGDKTTGEHHEALVFGNINNGAIGDGEDLLVRMHSSCRTNEVYDAINCECRDELHESMEQIKKEGRGVILYLEQEGRGTGIAGKLAQLNGMFSWNDGHIEQRKDDKGEIIDTDKAYKNAGFPSECRDFTVAGEMLEKLGVKSIRLLTNNPKKIEGIEKTGIKVTPVGIHILPENEVIRSDLRSKANNLGHYISEDDLA
ncbi:MAG: GTP cyclohydrolase II [Actinomycetota bacterium]